MLTIHTLGYQGWANLGWLDGFPFHRGAFLHGNDCNPLAGGIRIADLVVTVSPTYAREIVTPEGGFGLDGELRRRGDELVGILNGIDTKIWDPATDPNLVAPYDAGDPSAKAASQPALCEELGLDDGPGPLVVIVTRLVEQKGIDLVVPALQLLPLLPARIAVLGDGDRWLAETLHAAAARQPERVAFRQGYDEGLAHRMFAGGDLLLMPSRFEPCGLAQMQAMRYGTPVIATDVGGLHDTVVDVDLGADARHGHRCRDRRSAARARCAASRRAGVLESSPPGCDAPSGNGDRLVVAVPGPRPRRALRATDRGSGCLPGVNTPPGDSLWCRHGSRAEGPGDRSRRR